MEVLERGELRRVSYGTMSKANLVETRWREVETMTFGTLHESRRKVGEAAI